MSKCHFTNTANVSGTIRWSQEIILIDGYVDVSTLNLLAKKQTGVAVTIYTYKKTIWCYADEGCKRRIDEKTSEAAKNIGGYGLLERRYSNHVFLF